MNKFKEYLEAVSNKKLGLTDKIKKDILKDYKTWSSGFSPDEMEEKDHKKYVKFALNTNYKNLDKEILKWFSNYSTVKTKVVKETTKALENGLEELFYDKLGNQHTRNRTIDILDDLITQDDRYDSDKYSINDMDDTDMVSQAIKYLNKDKNRIKELIDELESFGN